MKKEEPKKFKEFQLDGITFFKYKIPNMYIYRVDIHKYIKDNNSTIIELVSTKDFETNKFIGLISDIYHIDKKSGCKFSKHIELVAAPEEFVKKHKL